MGGWEGVAVGADLNLVIDQEDGKNGLREGLVITRPPKYPAMLKLTELLSHLVTYWLSLKAGQYNM